MARARNIKPAFFKNEYLAELEPMARLLFIGLWCLADRNGRLEYRPKRIKAELFPYENIKIEKLLEDLASPRDTFIRIYSVKNIKYIQINNFLKHQNPHKNEVESGIPEPPDISEIQEIPEITRGLGEDSTSNRADSLNPITDSLLPIKGVEKEKNIISLFDFWNQQEIIKHSKLTEKMKKAIEERLKEYSVIEIKEFIKRYVTVINDKNYYFNTTWTLEEFFKQKNTMPCFTNEGSKWISYKNREVKKEDPKSINRNDGFDIEKIEREKRLRRLT